MAELLNQEKWALHFGDCIPHMAEDMPADCVDLSVFSVPFPSMFAYTSDEADIGNVDLVGDEVKLNFRFFFRWLLRVMKPGRVVIVHCMEIPRMKRAGGVGLCDFPGILLRLAERAGFIYEYKWAIRKNPQAQAIRTKSRNLQFAGLESDRAESRGALPDYLLKLRKPGENKVPVDSDGEVSRNNWIDWAECTWSDIRETRTLNACEGRGEGDTKHICPLQLDVIERCVRLFTNPEEVVFSPFAGIGSEGHAAIKLGRRFYGCELKREYYDAATRNCMRAVESARSAKVNVLF